jgi:hypothetical protein
VDACAVATLAATPVVVMAAITSTRLTVRNIDVLPRDDGFFPAVIARDVDAPNPDSRVILTRVHHRTQACAIAVVGPFDSGLARGRPWSFSARNA